MQARGVVAHSPLRLLSQLHLGEQVADRRIPTGERDAGRFTDSAASAVAADEILGPQGLTVRDLNVDASVLLRKAGYVTSAIDPYGQLIDPAGQEAFEVLLPEGEPVVVPSGKIADVQRHVGKSRDLHRLATREEAIDDPALIENLDGPRVKATRARAFELRTRAP